MRTSAKKQRGRGADNAPPSLTTKFNAIMEMSVKIGDKFISRNGCIYVVIDEYVNGNYKMTEQRGRKKPVQKSVPAWAIGNNLKSGYWTIA